MLSKRAIDERIGVLRCKLAFRSKWIHARLSAFVDFALKYVNFGRGLAFVKVGTFCDRFSAVSKCLFARFCHQALIWIICFHDILPDFGLRSISHIGLTHWITLTRQCTSYETKV